VVLNVLTRLFYLLSLRTFSTALQVRKSILRAVKETRRYLEVHPAIKWLPFLRDIKGTRGRIADGDKQAR
jgi:hypothetical protein